MLHETIHQVDPIALRQKLLKLGIGAKFPLSPSFAENAVQDLLNRHTSPVEILIPDDMEISGSVTGDVDCTCPKCGHEFVMDAVVLEAYDIPVPADALGDVVTLESVSNTMPTEVGSLVLSPAELAYMVDAWARLWEVPE